MPQKERSVCNNDQLNFWLGLLGVYVTGRVQLILNFCPISGCDSHCETRNLFFWRRVLYMSAQPLFPAESETASVAHQMHFAFQHILSSAKNAGHESGIHQSCPPGPYCPITLKRLPLPCCFVFTHFIDTNVLLWPPILIKSSLSLLNCWLSSKETPNEKKNFALGQLWCRLGDKISIFRFLTKTAAIYRSVPVVFNTGWCEGKVISSKLVIINWRRVERDASFRRDLYLQGAIHSQAYRHIKDHCQVPREDRNAASNTTRHDSISCAGNNPQRLLSWTCDSALPFEHELRSHWESRELWPSCPKELQHPSLDGKSHSIKTWQKVGIPGRRWNMCKKRKS